MAESEKLSPDDFCATCGWCGKHISMEWMCDCFPEESDDQAITPEQRETP